MDSLLSSYRLYLQETRAENSIYEELKTEFDAQLQGEESVIDLARDIYKYAEEFLNVEGIDSRGKFILANLNHTQYWKTILTTAKKDGFDNLDGLVDALVALYYSYWIAGHTSGKIKIPSYNILSLIKDGDGQEAVWDYIDKKRARDSITAKVRDGLYSDVYGADWHRPLLAMEYQMTASQKTTEIEPGVDIHREHILPNRYETAMENEEYWGQTFDVNEAAKIRHSLGNLTPLERAVHESIQQKPFDMKTAHYMGSGEIDASVAEDREATNFDLTRRVVDEYDEWTPEAVRDNRKYLVKQAAQLLHFQEEELLSDEDAQE